MNYYKFKEELKSNLTDILEERGYDVNIQDTNVHKANQDLDGIIVTLNDSGVSPTIYTEAYMESYSNINSLAEEIADKVERAYDNYHLMDFDPQEFNEEYIQKNSYISVVNTAMNQSLLSNVPHTPIDGTDLSAIAKVHVGNSASITITNDIASRMGITSSEVLDYATNNTLQEEYSVTSIQEAIASMMPDEASELLNIPEFRPNICVITNSYKYEGANAIISKSSLDLACEKMDCDSAVILPSSRHELLMVNVEDLGMESTAELKELVTSINASEVSQEDKLSDNIYQYDSITHQLSLCDENGLFRTDEIDNIHKDLSQGLGM